MGRLPNRFLGEPTLGARVDYGHPIARGLIGCWNLCEDAGLLTADLAGYGSGSLTGTTGYPTWSNGPYGSALQFDYTDNQQVIVPHNPARSLDPANGLTIQVIFYMNSSRNYNGLLNKSNTFIPEPFNIFVFGGGGAWRTILGNGAGATYTQDGSALAAGQWYDIVLSVGGTAPPEASRFGGYNPPTSDPIIAMYLDGKLDQVTFGYNPVGGFADGTNSIRIGNRNDDNVVPLDGKISRVRLWNRPLSIEEVRVIHRDPDVFIARPLWFPPTGVSVSLSDTGLFLLEWLDAQVGPTLRDGGVFALEWDPQTWEINITGNSSVTATVGSVEINPGQLTDGGVFQLEWALTGGVPDDCLSPPGAAPGGGAVENATF